MATDDERRRVAAALRKMSVYTLRGCGDDGSVTEWSVALMSELADAVCLKNAVGIEVFDRLADLIEPCDTSHNRRDTVACDREALLALAEGLCDGYPYGLSHGGLEQLARRIREACGEGVA